MLYVIHMIDRPESAQLRADHADAHMQFVSAHIESIYLGGPMLAEDGTTRVGSLVVMDFDSADDAAAFIADEPYNQAGLFESVTIRAFSPAVTPA